MSNKERIVYETVVAVHHDDEFYEDGAREMKVSLVEQDIEKLNAMAEVAKSVDAEIIGMAYKRVVFGEQQDGVFEQEECVSSECDRVVVERLSDDVKVYWEGRVSNRAITISSDWVSLGDINAALDGSLVE